MALGVSLSATSSVVSRAWERGQDVGSEVARPSAHSSCCSARTAPTSRLMLGRSGKMPTTVEQKVGQRPTASALTGPRGSRHATHQQHAGGSCMQPVDQHSASSPRPAGQPPLSRGAVVRRRGRPARARRGVHRRDRSPLPSVRRLRAERLQQAGAAVDRGGNGLTEATRCSSAWSPSCRVLPGDFEEHRRNSGFRSCPQRLARVPQQTPSDLGVYGQS
jgi:hypothetical protein